MPSVAPIPFDPAVDDFASARPRWRFGWSDAFAVAFGIAVTVVLGFYQFGRSNHTVYLLDALHRVRPDVLAGDWFTTQTFQHHALFGFLTRLLWDNVEAAFLVGYLALVVLFHVAWFRLVRQLGGGRVAYMASVTFLYASGGGTALGVYTFLQDNAFLPSNVASVALLWGVVLWTGGRTVGAGACFGVAAAFHLNYAVMAPLLWLTLLAWDARDRFAGRVMSVPPRRGLGRDHPRLTGTLLALLPAALTGAVAVAAMPQGGAVMPLGEFVDLYVRLRHPHHYDPRSWPVALWVSFLWPMPLALVGAWFVFRSRAASPKVAEAWRAGARVFAFFMVVVVVALVFAGLTFVSERLVQMSLYRFSVFPQLLACGAAAVWLCEGQPLGRASRWVVVTVPAVALLVAVLALTAGGRFRTDFGANSAFAQQLNVTPARIGCLLAFLPLGVMLVDRFVLRRRYVYAAGTFAIGTLLLVGWEYKKFGLLLAREDADYASVATWARRRTPANAVFLVPPDEETFRLDARRAIVVNFKAVPQLSRELPEWRDRLQSVLGLSDLRTLPRPMPETLAAIRDAYTHRPATDLFAAARTWGARYIVATRPLDDEVGMKPVFTSRGERPYFVYEVREK